jgi:hypothetical protein
MNRAVLRRHIKNADHPEELFSLIYRAGSNPALSTSRRGEMEHTIALEGVGMSVRLRPARIAEDRTTRRVIKISIYVHASVINNPARYLPPGTLSSFTTV